MSTVPERKGVLCHTYIYGWKPFRNRLGWLLNYPTFEMLHSKTGWRTWAIRTGGLRQPWRWKQPRDMFSLLAYVKVFQRCLKDREDAIWTWLFLKLLSNLNSVLQLWKWGARGVQGMISWPLLTGKKRIQDSKQQEKGGVAGVNHTDPMTLKYNWEPGIRCFSKQ